MSTIKGNILKTPLAKDQLDIYGLILKFIVIIDRNLDIYKYINLYKGTTPKIQWAKHISKPYLPLSNIYH